MSEQTLNKIYSARCLRFAMVIYSICDNKYDIKIVV